MKNLILAFIGCLFMLPAFAQDAEPANNNELGVDVTPFIRQFLSLNATPTPFLPYSVIYRRHLNDWAVRATIGGFYNDTETAVDDSTVIETTNSSAYFSAGIERKNQLAERWQLYYGIDLIAMMRSSKSDPAFGGGQFRQEQSGTGFGAAPLLGVRFNITDRISLTTETNLMIMMESETTELIHDTDPLFDSETSNDQLTARFNVPISLVVNFRF